MKEKLSLIRKAYNFKQSQWLDPTIPSDFCYRKSWVQAKPMVGPNKVLSDIFARAKVGCKIGGSYEKSLSVNFIFKF